MRPEELQIGDWVMCENHPYQIRKLGIYGEDRDGNDYPAVCIGKPNGIGLIVERNEISPIPITPEILEKNGFRKTKGYATTTYEWTVMDGVTIYINIFEDNDIIVGIETKPKKGIGVNRLHHCDIKYVHQLQQAMRLCGINKEITLN